MDRHVGIIVDLFIRQTVVDADQRVAAAAVDDILGFEPMEMVCRRLAFLEVEQLFCINLGVFICHFAVAVADGDE